MNNQAVSGKLFECVFDALSLAATAHHWHLSVSGQGSYARHQAFGDLYELFHSIADTLSESAQGAWMVHPKDRKAGIVAFGSESGAIAQIEQFCDKLSKLSDSLLDQTGMEWLANEVQGAQGDLYKVLYKLKKLS